jgi:hypothetical protein
MPESRFNKYNATSSVAIKPEPPTPIPLTEARVFLVSGIIGKHKPQPSYTPQQWSTRDQRQQEVVARASKNSVVSG